MVVGEIRSPALTSSYVQGYGDNVIVKNREGECIDDEIV